MKRSDKPITLVEIYVIFPISGGVFRKKKKKERKSKVFFTIV